MATVPRFNEPASNGYPRQPRLTLNQRRAAFVRRIRTLIRAMFARGDVSTLCVTVALMIIPALALNGLLQVPSDAAYWTVGLNQLVLVGLASVVFGYFLARSRYNELMALMMSGVYGIATIAAVQILAAPGDPLGRLTAVIGRLRGSLIQVQTGGAIQDPFVLILFLSTLFWFLGHNTAWHVFRINRVWRAVVPPGIVLLINGLYNFGPVNLDLYLIGYVFLALLLVVRSHIEAREYEWYIHQVGYDRRLRTWFYRTGVVAGIAVLLIAWALPTGSSAQNQQRFQQFMNGDVLTQLNKLLERLFTPLDSTGTTTADYYGRDQLQLGGTIQLGDQEVLHVKVAQAPATGRYYWQSHVFDTYHDGEWEAARGLNVTAQTSPLTLPLEPYAFPGARQDLPQTFMLINGPSRLIYAAPQARQINLPAQAEADYINPQTKTVNAAVIRPLAMLQVGDTYDAVSSISVVSADTLRTASTQYPAWLSLDEGVDPGVAPRTQALAVKIVTDAKAATAYDKAKAIETWLRENIAYDEYMPTLPTNEDVIDWALFTVKRAYCTYYASAMVIMLRSQRIPARMAAGFAQGTWDGATQSYIVRERDAHTWVEVYFPGAGWVEFEPTAAQPALNRLDPRAPQPTPTITPTFTPSPTPLPTATPQAKPLNSSQQTIIAPTSTPPPTNTALPQPTPIPLPDNTGSPPSTLPGLLRLLTIFAAIVAGVSFAGVALLWWVEYRGLDRLSPVGRAYARLTQYGRWLHIPAGPGATPLERGRRIAREVPEKAANIIAITDLYIHEQYAPPRPISPVEEERARIAWQATRIGLIRRKLRQWLHRS